ncbi:hypothetical protein NXS19_001170 [Fusarium pseudograminearum]|nr:hypothetical protein NXS19_001170 [Fusarium pseudograminearum]
MPTKKNLRTTERPKTKATPASQFLHLDILHLLHSNLPTYLPPSHPLHFQTCFFKSPKVHNWVALSDQHGVAIDSVSKLSHGSWKAKHSVFVHACSTCLR